MADKDPVERAFLTFMVLASLMMLALAALVIFVILAGLGIVHVVPGFFH